MTREEILALNENELDIAVAVEIFGHKRDRYRYGWVELGNLSTYPKRYSRDISAAYEVEEKIKELGLQVKYTQALKLLIIGEGEYAGMFDFIHATPEQRCKAALIAVLEG